MIPVLVIGGGVGGSVAAIALARRGVQVHLVEQRRFPSDKTCGECLSALGMDCLRRLELDRAVRSAGAMALTQARAYAPGGAIAEIPLAQPMWGISRRKLDALLLEKAAAAGVVVHQPIRCEQVSLAGHWQIVLRDLRDNRTSQLQAASILLASGRAPAGTGRPRDMGLKAHFQNVAGVTDAVELFGLDGHYAGLAPVEDGKWNLAMSVPADRLQALHGQFDALLEASPLLRDRLSGATRCTPWKAAPLERFAVQLPWGPNLVPVGNAAAALEPIGGEGMGLAMASALLAAEAWNDGWEAPIQRQLRAKYRRLWRRRSVMCRLAALVLSRPRIAGAAVRILGWSPGMSQRLPAAMGKSCVIA